MFPKQCARPRLALSSVKWGFWNLHEHLMHNNIYVEETLF